VGARSPRPGPDAAPAEGVAEERGSLSAVPDGAAHPNRPGGAAGRRGAAASATSEASAEQAVRRAQRRETRHSGVLLWALGIALAVVVMLFAAQLQRSGQLAEQVGALEAELEASRAALAAYESHLGEVRNRVGGLSAQVRELEALVERGPAESTSD